MSPEQQRIAIATACGCLHQRRPDYLNDLNACHEMEERLSETDSDKYAAELSWITVNGFGILDEKNRPANRTCFKYAHATAAQRSEAFLRTKGLWKEEEVTA